MKTVLDPSDPSVDVKVTNQTGKEVTLHGWLNDQPASVEVPARSAIVKLTFPAMTEGQAKLTLSVTAEGIEDTEVHEVVVMAKGYGYPPYPTPSNGTGSSANPSPSTPGDTTNASSSPKPVPSSSKAPKPKPSWSKWPKPSKSSWHSMTPTPSPSASELPKTGTAVSSYVLLGGGLLVFGMFVLGLAWALGRRTASESAREG